MCSSILLSHLSVMRNDSTTNVIVLIYRGMTLLAGTSQQTGLKLIYRTCFSKLMLTLEHNYPSDQLLVQGEFLCQIASTVFCFYLPLFFWTARRCQESFLSSCVHNLVYAWRGGCENYLGNLQVIFAFTYTYVKNV